MILDKSPSPSRRRTNVTVVVLTLLVGLTTTGSVSQQTSPPGIALPPATAAREPQERKPPSGKTLVPAIDPRCSLVMPTYQTYREVPIDVARQPPKCG
jgi:hypothetical protein